VIQCRAPPVLHLYTVYENRYSYRQVHLRHLHTQTATGLVDVRVSLRVSSACYTSNLVWTPHNQNLSGFGSSLGRENTPRRRKIILCHQTINIITRRLGAQALVANVLERPISNPDLGYSINFCSNFFNISKRNTKHRRCPRKYHAVCPWNLMSDCCSVTVAQQACNSILETEINDRCILLL
jgi:hypothetical protein